MEAVRFGIMVTSRKGLVVCWFHHSLGSGPWCYPFNNSEQSKGLSSNNGEQSKGLSSNNDEQSKGLSSTNGEQSKELVAPVAG